MARDNDDERLTLGVDYDLARWTTGEQDEGGRLIWHQTLPTHSDWDRIRMVTIEYDLDGEGHARNIPIPADRPLDPYGSDSPSYRGPHRGGRYGPDFYYDLDDLATNWFWGTDTP